MSSYVYMDAHQLRDLCNKVIETIDACRQNDMKLFLSQISMQRNAKCSWWFGKRHIWTPEEVETDLKGVHGIFNVEANEYYSISIRWGSARDTATRLLATTHYSHNVHVSSLDLDYLHPWVK